MKVSDKRLAEALIECFGNQSEAAALVGVSQPAVSKRIKDSEELQAARDEGLMRFQGEAQLVLLNGLRRVEKHKVYKDGAAVGVELLEEPDKVAVDAAKWSLARLGKGRWSERQEVTGADGAPVFNITVNVADAEATD